MNRAEMTNAIEALLFAAGEPLKLDEIKQILTRALADCGEEERQECLGQLKGAVGDLRERWHEEEPKRGFVLLEVAGALTFRSNPAYAPVLRAMREKRPVRLSRAALETLAIVAYRQPATKPDVDFIRGVDSGGTLRWLLDRDLVRIVGKKEEPGRPLLYGTTSQFLSFFSLGTLSELPPLKDFHELTDEGREELADFDAANPSLQQLSEAAQKLRSDEEPLVAALDDAIKDLEHTEVATTEAFAAAGVNMGDDDGEDGQSKPKTDAAPEASGSKGVGETQGKPAPSGESARG